MSFSVCQIRFFFKLGILSLFATNLGSFESTHQVIFQSFATRSNSASETERHMKLIKN